MARLTINFSNKYSKIYDKVMSEENASKIICEILEDHYNSNKSANNEDIIEKLDMILDKIDDIGVVSHVNEDTNEDVSDLIDVWDE